MLGAFVAGLIVASMGWGYALMRLLEWQTKVEAENVMIRQTLLDLQSSINTEKQNI